MDEIARPFLPEGRLAEFFAGPQLVTYEERRAMADAVLAWLQSEYPHTLIAVALFGSTALRKDGPFSDVEVWAAVEDNTSGADTGLAWVWGPSKVEIEVMSVTQAITRAAAVDGRWPVTAGRFVQAMPLWEAPRQAGFVDRIRSSASDLPEVARREAMAECALALYDLLAKLRNCRVGPAADVPRLISEFAAQAVCLVALHHRYAFGSSRRIFVEGHKLIGPDGYKPMLEAIAQGHVGPDKAPIDLADRFWAGLPAWVEQVGLDLSACVRALPDPTGVAAPAEPDAGLVAARHAPQPRPRRARGAPPKRRLFGG